MNEKIEYGKWGRLFKKEFSNETYDALSLEANHRTASFMQRVRNGEINIADDLTPRSQHPGLDKWVAANDELLCRLVRDIQQHVLSVVKFALPAHDERQICFKDASEGIRYSKMEKPQGYKSTFVIAMFCHDIGRLLEGRMYAPDQNPHDQWIAHSKFSFMMLQDILDQPEYGSMPEELKNHLLYAVLAHSGDNGESYMSRAVQTCDRMQLIGAEGFYRALSYGTCLMNAHIRYPDDKDYKIKLPTLFEHRSVLSILEYCSRNMRENIGETHAKEWQRRIAIENVVLLLAACEENDELALRIFAPELDVTCEYDTSKGKIDAGILKEAYELYEREKYIGDMRWSPYELSEIAIEAIQGPEGAAQITDDMKKSLIRALEEMPEIERKSLFRMMMLANKFREEQDDIDMSVCMDLEDNPQKFISTIARAVRKYANSAMPKSEAIYRDTMLACGREP